MVGASRSASFSLLLVLVMFMMAQAADYSNGLSWGFTRTYWEGTWYGDGYAEAGTGGNVFGLRHERSIAEHTLLAIVGSYSWMGHTTTTLREPVIFDPETDEVISGGSLDTRTDKTYFREAELAAHVHYFLDDRGRQKLYVGGGPSARWGAAGKREQDAHRAEFHTQAAWFGFSALAGLRQQWSEDGLVTFFEPRLLWSPDGADRYQTTFPPVNLILSMGILW